MTRLSAQYFFCIFQIALFVFLLPRGACHAADIAANKPAICGGYAYTLPEGFREAHFQKEFSENISISDIWTNSELQESFIACITISHSNKDFVLDTAKSIITNDSKRIKHKVSIHPYRYYAQFPDDIRLYTFYNFNRSHTERAFFAYMIELQAYGNNDNAILYVEDSRPVPLIKDDLRTREQLAIDSNTLRKERAMRLISSIRRIE